MTDFRKRVMIELQLDQALVLHEYLSKKADLFPDEFAAEFEDKSEDLVATYVCVALETQLDAEGVFQGHWFPAVEEARRRVRESNPQ